MPAQVCASVCVSKNLIIADLSCVSFLKKVTQDFVISLDQTINGFIPEDSGSTVKMNVMFWNMIHFQKKPTKRDILGKRLFSTSPSVIILVNNLSINDSFECIWIHF